MSKYIKREAALKELEVAYNREKQKSDALVEAGNFVHALKHSRGAFCYENAKEIIKSTPTADVAEVKHGEWEYDPDGMDWQLGAWVCSLCKVKNDNLGGSKNINPYVFAGSQFCPHCGAKMDRKEG